MIEEFITGYQFSPQTSRYVGEYSFPKNKDKEEIHLPPHTTMTPPPSSVPEGKCCFWENNEWVIKDNPDPKHQKPIIEDYALLTEDFIQHLKDNNLWTSEDEQSLIDRLAEIEAANAEQE